MKRDGIAVYGFEAQPEGRPFVTSREPGWEQVTANRWQHLFQKECLLNMAEKLVPPNFTKVAWVDADLFFDNDAWIEGVSRTLDETPVCQPFEMAWWTDREGRVSMGRPPATLVGIRNSSGHPGFAWAATRDFFTMTGGLYSKTPVGSGDTIFTCAVLDQTPVQGSRLTEVGKNPAEFEHWKARVQKWLAGRRPGCVPGSVVHEWHGERADRQYASRKTLLEHFDSSLHVRIAENGLLQWTELAPILMKRGVAEYFTNRKEDG